MAPNSSWLSRNAPARARVARPRARAFCRTRYQNRQCLRFGRKRSDFFCQIVDFLGIVKIYTVKSYTRNRKSAIERKRGKKSIDFGRYINLVAANNLYVKIMEISTKIPVVANIIFYLLSQFFSFVTAFFFSNWRGRRANW